MYLKLKTWLNYQILSIDKQMYTMKFLIIIAWKKLKKKSFLKNYLCLNSDDLSVLFQFSIGANFIKNPLDWDLRRSWKKYERKHFSKKKTFSDLFFSSLIGGIKKIISVDFFLRDIQILFVCQNQTQNFYRKCFLKSYFFSWR